MLKLKNKGLEKSGKGYPHGRVREGVSILVR